MALVLPENNRPPRGERPASSGDDLSVPRQRPSPRLPPGTNYKGETYDLRIWVRAAKPPVREADLGRGSGGTG